MYIYIYIYVYITCFWPTFLHYCVMLQLWHMDISRLSTCGPSCIPIYVLLTFIYFIMVFVLYPLLSLLCNPSPLLPRYHPSSPCKLSCSEPQRMLLSVELPILCFFNILASMFLAFSKLCFPKGHIVFTIFKLLVMLSGVRLVQVLRLHPVQVPVLAVLMGLMLKLQTPCIQAGTARRGVLLVLRLLPFIRQRFSDLGINPGSLESDDARRPHVRAALSSAVAADRGNAVWLGDDKVYSSKRACESALLNLYWPNVCDGFVWNKTPDAFRPAQHSVSTREKAAVLVLFCSFQEKQQKVM